MKKYAEKTDAYKCGYRFFALKRLRATSPMNGEVCGTVKTVSYTHKIQFTG